MQGLKETWEYHNNLLSHHWAASSRAAVRRQEERMEEEQTKTLKAWMGLYHGEPNTRKKIAQEEEETRKWIRISATELRQAQADREWEALRQETENRLRFERQQRLTRELNPELQARRKEASYRQWLEKEGYSQTADQRAKEISEELRKEKEAHKNTQRTLAAEQRKRHPKNDHRPVPADSEETGEPQETSDRPDPAPPSTAEPTVLSRKRKATQDDGPP